MEKILDMGTGSGIIAIFFLLIKAQLEIFNPQIYASDILDEALNCAKFNEKLNNFNQQIQFIKSDLFNSFPASLKQSFDVIVFNPPYLPSSKLIDFNKKKRNIDHSWNGGKSGNEVLIRFLHNVRTYINTKSNDKCYIYFINSTRSEKEDLDDALKEEGYMRTILEKKHVFFEDIVLNRLEISNF